MPAILFKEIKPARLQEKKMNDALKRELETISKDMLFDFEVTVYTWNKKPKFQRLLSVGPGSVDILVGTDDEIYKYVDEGTKRHFVAPKNAPALAWQTGYAPKTVAGKMIAQPGGAFGNFAYDAKGHFVKGIKARKFTKTIQKSWEKKFKTRMEKAMRDAVQVSGNFYSAGFWS
jgi:hypothetical protein